MISRWYLAYFYWSSYSNRSSTIQFFSTNKKKKLATKLHARKFTLSSFTSPPFKVFDHRFRFTRLPFSISLPAFLHGQKRQFSSTSSPHTDSFYEQMHSLRWRAELLHFSPRPCLLSLSLSLSRAFFFLLSFLKKCFIRDEIASRAFQEKYFTISHDNIYDGQRIVDTESVNQQLCCFEFLYFA